MHLLSFKSKLIQRFLNRKRHRFTLNGWGNSSQAYVSCNKQVTKSHLLANTWRTAYFYLNALRRFQMTLSKLIIMKINGLGFKSYLPCNIYIILWTSFTSSIIVLLFESGKLYPCSQFHAACLLENSHLHLVLTSWEQFLKQHN